MIKYCTFCKGNYMGGKNDTICKRCLLKILDKKVEKAVKHDVQKTED